MADVNLDWITIRYRDIYKVVGTIVVVGVLSAAGFFGYRMATSERFRASHALSRADEQIKRLGEIPDNPEIAQGRKDLNAQYEEAKADFSNGNYSQASEKAKSIENTAIELLAGVAEKELLATVLQKQGEAKVKRRGGVNRWQDVRQQVTLHEGDTIKTGSDGQVRIKYPDGRIQTVPPDSYVSITILSSDQTVIQVQGGGTEMETPDNVDPSSQMGLKTPDDVSVRGNPGSHVIVNVDDSGGTTVDTTRGGAVVEKDGEERQLGAQERIKVDPGAGFGEILHSVPPPVPLTPEDKHLFMVATPEGLPLHFQWKSNGKKSKIQLATSLLYGSDKLVDRDVLPQKDSASGSLTVTGLVPGVYFWRLKSVSDGNDPSFWTLSNQFRIVRQNSNASSSTEKTLRLEVQWLRLGSSVAVKRRHQSRKPYRH